MSRYHNVLPIPKKARRRRQEALQGLPFPNFCLGKTEIPSVCRCSFDSGQFLVSNQLDIHTLYHNGCFGTSTRTFRAPSYASNNFLHQPYFKKKLDGVKRPKLEESPEEENIPVTKHLEEEEKLVLMPEEAIFLSFGVGCLQISNKTGENLSYMEVWKELCKVSEDFPLKYAVYHYYRAKNWVVKCGDSFDADYVLYEQGPEVNHASFIVHLLEAKKTAPTWMEVSSWQRLATHVAKQLLVCQVTLPPNFVSEASEPRFVFKMKINEMTLRRWLPTSEN